MIQSSYTVHTIQPLTTKAEQQVYMLPLILSPYINPCPLSLCREYDNLPQLIKEDRETLLARFRAEQRARKLLFEDRIFEADDLEILTIETEDNNGTHV